MNHYQHLAQEERYMIYKLLQQHYSIRAISRLINRSASTVMREIKRNTGKRGYRNKQANSFAQERLHTSHRNTRITPEAIELAKSLVNMDWSPEQVSNRLKMDYNIHISTETIYQVIFKDKADGGSLYKHLRQSRKKRRKRNSSGYKSRGQIKNKIPIDERPSIVETRERIGDWEIDTVVGKQHKGAVISIVERKSRFSLLAIVDQKTSDLVSENVIELLYPYKDNILTITSDNGKEFAGHEQIMKELNTTFYFAHPYSSWERGLNENTNGLIRQYIPKGSEILHLTNDDMVEIMEKLNNRPRKCLE